MLAVIRVRGNINIKKELKHTLELLNLYRVNHLVLVNEDKKNKKMVEKVKDYITYGEITEETLIKALEKRGRLPGNKRLTDKFLEENKLGDFTTVAKKVLEGAKLEKMGIKPVLRLTPPKKGYERKGIKKPFKIGGVLGYRGEEINKLIKKMI